MVAPQRLPVSATPLVGRARELVLLRQLLLDGDVRAVTITGPAGVGKTRLAIEVAAALAPDFAGQVVAVNLAPLLDPALVESAVAKALGVETPADEPEGCANAFMPLAGTHGASHRAGLVGARRSGGPRRRGSVRCRGPAPEARAPGVLGAGCRARRRPGGPPPGGLPNDQQPIQALGAHRTNPPLGVAESALQPLVGHRTEAVDQLGEADQILDPERAPPSSHRHKHVRRNSVGPASRQRPLAAVVLQEEHPVLAPGLTHSDEHKLPPRPRVKRVRHPDSPLPSSGIRRS